MSLSGEDDLWRGVAVAEEDAGTADRCSLAGLPLVILVGVTGSGKSTTVERLRELLPLTLLPDRRTLADRVVLPAMQRELGLARTPVADRVERFRLTAAYRRRHPGGMAHALSRLCIDASAARGALLFDGLRGVDEVGWAVGRFRLARFVALDAPAIVRLARLIGRGDAFDRATVHKSGTRRGLEPVYAEVPGLEALVTPGELRRLVASLAAAARERLVEKATILVAEAENYDPAATLRLLEERLPEERLLVLDTARTGPEEAAERVAGWLA